MALRLRTSRAVQERSIATRAALLDAALESLLERGYAGVTTTDIAPRVGVSRGAQLHHFPTKQHLLAAVVEHLLERSIREFREAMIEASSRTDRVDAALDVLWTVFQGPVFVAWVELWIAARTDPGLAAAMTEVDHRFTEESRNMAREFFGVPSGGDFPSAALLRDFAFALMTGVAFQRLLPRGQRPAADYIAILKRVARVILGAEPAS
jgi:AcrR family transcriptional regulator